MHHRITSIIDELIICQISWVVSTQPNNDKIQAERRKALLEELDSELSNLKNRISFLESNHPFVK